MGTITEQKSWSVAEFEAAVEELGGLP